MTSRLLLRYLLPLLGWAAGVAVAAVPELVPAMPGPGDHTLLSWREGPPYGTNLRYAVERRFLRLETGWFAADFDTEHIALAGFAAFPAARSDAAATASALAATVLPSARWQLVVRVGPTSFTCVGRRPLTFDNHGLPAAPLEFPVQVIESGRFFQKFALHDLEFHDSGGRRLAVRARLEVTAWPSRWAVSLVLQPEGVLAEARVFLRVQTAGGRDASFTEPAAVWPSGREHRATLTLDADGMAADPGAPSGVEVNVQPLRPQDRAAVVWNPGDGAYHVRLESAAWPAPAEGIYPEEKLDAWESYAVTLQNGSAAEQEVRLNFEENPSQAITGYVPMLLDARGAPTGIPIQISKNWHLARAEVQPVHAGHWRHGRTLVRLPPGGRVHLRHGTTFARWGGAPTASLAQLSLIGWGHNGFWEQFALGSFGESFCFQPARVMRRALLTDFRPLAQRGFARDERWAWATNVGGGDTLVWHDPRGRYVPLKRNVTRHAASGPNLAQLDYEEVSSDEAVRSQVTVWLPQAEDYVRVYLKIKYEVRKPVRFSRLALFQFGADLYNDCQAKRVAWGAASGLTRELEPPAGSTHSERWEGRGVAAWVSLHGQARADQERTGQASRGLIVREWRARLGGRTIPAPWFVTTRGQSSRAPLGVDLIPPPEVTALQPGDGVELLLELVAFPLAAERYYGSDGAFLRVLADGANTWRPVLREAAGHQPWLERADGSRVEGFPLTLVIADGAETTFRLRDAVGLVPVRLAGLAGPDVLQLRPVRRGRSDPAVPGSEAPPYWQTDYNPATQRWTRTYSLTAADAGADYEVRTVPASPGIPAGVR